MIDEQLSVGTKWLQEASDNGSYLAIFLNNGIRLTGRLCDFDDDHLLITNAKQPKLHNTIVVNRKNVSSITVDKTG